MFENKKAIMRKESAEVQPDNSCYTWLKKDECVQFFENEVDPSDFIGSIDSELCRNGVSASITPGILAVDDNVQDGRSFCITPTQGKEAQTYYVTVSNEGPFTTVKQSTYVDAPKLPVKPRKQRKEGGLMIPTLVFALGYVARMMGMAFRQVNDIGGNSVHIVGKKSIEMPTFSLEALRNVGGNMQVIGTILLLIGLFALVYGVYCRYSNIAKIREEKKWDDAWQSWRSDSLETAYRNDQSYALIDSFVSRSIASVCGNSIKVQRSNNRMSDIDSIAGFKQQERR